MDWNTSSLLYMTLIEEHNRAQVTKDQPLGVHNEIVEERFRACNTRIALLDCLEILGMLFRDQRKHPEKLVSGTRTEFGSH